MRKNIFIVSFLIAILTISNNAFCQDVDPFKDDVKDIPSFNIVIKASQKESLFKTSKVKYLIKLVNKNSEAQEGTVKIEVRTDKGKLVSGIKYEVSVAPNSTTYLKPKFTIKDPGFYDLWVTAGLSSYDDTIRNVFGVKAKSLNTTVHKPDDFMDFWNNALKELRGVDPKYSIRVDSAQSTSSHNVYLVTMHSIGGAIVHGWLSVPKVAGHYPVLVGLPGYKVILKPLYGDEFITFQFNIRSSKPKGEVLQDKEWDYTLINIDNKDNYIYRGAYMDCIRAIDFLYTFRDFGVDTSRIAVSGGSQGGALALVVAALDHRVKACIADNPIYCDIHNLLEISEKRNPIEWPVNRYKSYLQQSPGLTMKNILNTMDYYDPQNFTPMIQCPVLLGLGLLDKLAPPATIFAAYNKLNDAVKEKSETYSFYRLAHEVTTRHRKFQNQWLLEKLAFPYK